MNWQEPIRYSSSFFLACTSSPLARCRNQLRDGAFSTVCRSKSQGDWAGAPRVGRPLASVAAPAAPLEPALAAARIAAVQVAGAPLRNKEIGRGLFILS